MGDAPEVPVSGGTGDVFTVSSTGSLRLQTAHDDHAREEWEAAAAGVLRRTGRLADEADDSAVWEELARVTLDGIVVAPLGTPGLADQSTGGGRPTRSGAWDVRVLLEGAPGLVNDEVLADLQGGASSVWLGVGHDLPADRISEALHDVQLELTPIVLDTTAGHPLEAARGLVDALGDRPAAPGTNLGVDPLSAVIATAESDVASDSAGMATVVSGAARLAQEADTLALVVDGTSLHDLGASDAQELGWSMAVGITYLRMLEAAGIGVDDAAALMEFRYAVSDEQFPSIAKLRAARRLWGRVVEASGGENIVQRQHAVTSRPMLGRYDPYVNILRTTVAAFAAGVGGADAVTVLPFDSPLGRPDSRGRRIARNISHLLIQESHLAQVADPAGGSYAVERLTHDLARAGWEELGRIESAGGALAAIGEVRERVAAVAQKRERAVATRRRPLTGVTEFPNLDEDLLRRSGRPQEVRRYGAAFEAMRDDPATRPAFLATMGPVAAHTARARFATSLFAAGGIAMQAAGASEGVDEVIAAYHEAGAPPVVCLAGTDVAYAKWGAELIAALRAEGASYLVLSGEPGEKAGIPDSAVDDSAAMGVDAIALLTPIRAALA